MFYVKDCIAIRHKHVYTTEDLTHLLAYEKRRREGEGVWGGGGVKGGLLIYFTFLFLVPLLFNLYCQKVG